MACRRADRPSRWLCSRSRSTRTTIPISTRSSSLPAILQPPFFDATADDAVNYGSFGAVVGHEMTHGPDDQGSQYDASSNLVNWWQKKDKEEYERRVAVQVEQANNQKVPTCCPVPPAPCPAFGAHALRPRACPRARAHARAQAQEAASLVWPPHMRPNLPNQPRVDRIFSVLISDE